MAKNLSHQVLPAPPPSSCQPLGGLHHFSNLDLFAHLNVSFDDDSQSDGADQEHDPLWGEPELPESLVRVARSLNATMDSPKAPPKAIDTKDRREPRSPTGAGNECDLPPVRATAC
jgi:hypothetical protein